MAKGHITHYVHDVCTVEECDNMTLSASVVVLQGTWPKATSLIMYMMYVQWRSVIM